MKEYHLIKIAFATPEYDDTVGLRTEVLRVPLGMTFNAEDLAAEYDQDLFALYDSSDRLVGCLVFKEIDPYTTKMRQVAISPLLQNQGIGQILVKKAEEWCKFKGYKKIVLSARESAVNFYLKMDYNLEGDLFEEVGIPHRHMFKEF